MESPHFQQGRCYNKLAHTNISNKHSMERARYVGFKVQSSLMRLCALSRLDGPGNTSTDHKAKPS